MGMFDEFVVRCPKCNEYTMVQTKAGDCILAVYNAETAPPEILGDVAGDHFCDNCSECFTIKVHSFVSVY